ncbi:MAG: addiction module protein [Bacteroidia bacterium]
MSAAQMRKKILEKIDILDEQKLHQILDLINEGDNEESYWSPEFIKELDKRREEMLSGKVKGISAEELTKRVREKIIQKHGKNS